MLLDLFKIQAHEDLSRSSCGEPALEKQQKSGAGKAVWVKCLVAKANLL